MEFYQRKIVNTCIPIIVSIPNGMEFYKLQPKKNFLWRLFQFPTGWNSTIPRSLTPPIISRFNSQRDGILHCSQSIRGREFGKFQFPTGWNSTWDDRARILTEVVSIPNGMEFYGSKRKSFLFRRLFQFPTGWNSTLYCSATDRKVVISFNSQRDGILHDCVPILVDDFSSFNSQRDGILQIVSFFYFLELPFQFPTGWNSTTI